MIDVVVRATVPCTRCGSKFVDSFDAKATIVRTRPQGHREGDVIRVERVFLEGPRTCDTCLDAVQAAALDDWVQVTGNGGAA